MRRVSQGASRMLVAVAFVAMTAQSAAAQARGGAGDFHPGYTDIGPVIGLGGIGGANIAIGGRFEHGIQTLPSLANGILGFQVGLDYWSWSRVVERPAGVFFSERITYLPIGATFNYHFKLDEPKLDPFVGLGLGYDIINCSGSIACDNSGLYLISRGGIRYFMSPSLALYGDVGAGAAALNLGLMFKMQ